MLSWGIVLMLFGVFSLVLPLVGQQFILVSKLGIPASGSLLILAVGALLFYLGNEIEKKKRKEQKDEIHPVVAKLGKRICPECGDNNSIYNKYCKKCSNKL